MRSTQLPYVGSGCGTAVATFLEVGTARRRNRTRVFLQAALHRSVPWLVIGAELAYVLATGQRTGALRNGPASAHSQREGEHRNGNPIP